jgi:hypothetical protein
MKGRMIASAKIAQAMTETIATIRLAGVSLSAE